MSPIDDIKHFLVTRDTKLRRTEVEDFGTDYDAAQVAYRKAEQQASDHPELDVVLLSADSLDTVKRTHSSYFEPMSLDEMLPA